MQLTPELIEHAAKEINLANYYKICGVVTAQHVLYESFIEKTKWKGVPKIIFYILLEKAFGAPRFKDFRGDLGFPIELLTNEADDKPSVATKLLS